MFEEGRKGRGCCLSHANPYLPSCSHTDNSPTRAGSKESPVFNAVPSNPGAKCAELQPVPLPQHEPQVLSGLCGGVQPFAAGGAGRQQCFLRQQQRPALLPQQQLQGNGQDSSQGHGLLLTLCHRKAAAAGPGSRISVVCSFCTWDVDLSYQGLAFFPGVASVASKPTEM